MNTSAKGKRLELKSIKWLSADGAHVIFRAKGIRQAEKFLQPGVCQVDLICLYPEGANKVVEVTTPANRSRARQRLERLPLPPGWLREIHVWGREKRPDVIPVTRTEAEQ